MRLAQLEEEKACTSNIQKARSLVVLHSETTVISESLFISQTSGVKCMNFLNTAKTTAIIQLRQLQLNGPCGEKHSGIIILGVYLPARSVLIAWKILTTAPTLKSKKRPRGTHRTLSPGRRKRHSLPRLFPLAYTWFIF